MEEREFLYRLAFEFGEPNPEYLEAKLPAHVLDEWKAYFAKEPRGQARDDWRMAKICWNVFQGLHSKASTQPKDHLFTWYAADGADEPETEQDMLSREGMLKAFFRARRQRQ